MTIYSDCSFLLNEKTFRPSVKLFRLACLETRTLQVLSLCSSLYSFLKSSLIRPTEILRHVDLVGLVDNGRGGNLFLSKMLEICVF